MLQYLSNDKFWYFASIVSGCCMPQLSQLKKETRSFRFICPDFVSPHPGQVADISHPNRVEGVCKHLKKAIQSKVLEFQTVIKCSYHYLFILSSFS